MLYTTLIPFTADYLGMVRKWACAKARRDRYPRPKSGYNSIRFPRKDVNTDDFDW
jgi:hypothetical protein